MTKTQKFLQNRRIVDVKHLPKKLILTLDNGNHFEVSCSVIGYEVQSYGLDFKFNEK